MFRRLKLSVTRGPINNSSSIISLFLFNLFPQQSILGTLEFWCLCCTYGCCTTKQNNTEKGYSYIPSTSQPLIHPNTPLHTHPPSRLAHSEVLEKGTVRNYGDGNEGKILISGGGTSGSYFQIIQDGGGVLSPLIKALSMCATPREGSRCQEQRPCIRKQEFISVW